MFEIYGSIGIASGVVQAAYLLTAFGLGFVLLSRARSSGDPHPRLLGWHLILSMGVGYLLLCIAVASFELGIEMDPTWRGAFVGFGNLVTSMGLLATLVFTRRVFRPDDPLATAAVWILGSLMFSGLAIYGLTGGFPTARYDNVGGAVLLLGIFGSNVWVSYEPLRYYRLMKRRLEFGLADPAVVDRFLLWGLGSASRLLLSGLGVGAALTVRHFEPAAALTVSKITLIGTSICGIVTSLAYWQAFHPSQAYLRWIERRQSRSPR